MAIDWKSLKKEYETESSSVRLLSEKYSCHESSIKKKIKKNKWQRFSNSGLSSDKENEIIKENILKNHRMLWQKIREMHAKFLNEGGVENSKELKLYTEALEKIEKGERLAWNLDDNSENFKIDELFGLAEEMEQTLSHRRAGETLEGE